MGSLTFNLKTEVFSVFNLCEVTPTGWNSLLGVLGLQSFCGNSLFSELKSDSLRLCSHFLLACEEAIVEELCIVHACLINLHLASKDFCLIFSLPLSISVRHDVEPCHQLHPL